MSFKFKPAELGSEAKKAIRSTKWKHIRKTALYMVLGIAVSIIFNYLLEGGWRNDEISNAAFFGAFIGFFLTNSPCAKGSC